ncbi:MAG: hypothetical protein D3926_07030 [Desulfobacteraceae bacterium]|nr:MAG: hypothetical protein D3926_07030 [Desulfobacteraceae bacterium]
MNSKRHISLRFGKSSEPLIIPGQEAVLNPFPVEESIEKQDSSKTLAACLPDLLADAANIRIAVAGKTIAFMENTSLLTR